MTNENKSVPPSETTQQETKVEDAIHEQAAEELDKEPETEVVSLDNFLEENDEGGD